MSLLPMSKSTKVLQAATSCSAPPKYVPGVESVSNLKHTRAVHSVGLLTKPPIFTFRDPQDQSLGRMTKKAPLALLTFGCVETQRLLADNIVNDVSM